MAKNNARKDRPKDQQKPQTEKAASPAAAAAPEEAGSGLKDILYQVKTRRDAGVIKAYITFTYRVFHPGVTPRLLLYGLIIMLPGIFYFKDIFWRLFFIVIGAALILLALFRQHISVMMTKRNDPDYKSGAEFTYNFGMNAAEFLKDGRRFAKLDRYKDITNFYYDEKYLYLAVKSRDLFVIPKSAFTIGDAAGFEEFIYKKSKHSCRWIPDSFSGWLKKRRAERSVAAEQMAAEKKARR